MEQFFSLDEARAMVPALHRHVTDLVGIRADLAEAQAALQRGVPAEVGGIPEVKALEARLQEAVDWFAQRGLQLKGLAPVTVDFAAELDGRPVLWCWLEGEESLDWYHLPDVGFMGRRRLPDRR